MTIISYETITITVMFIYAVAAAVFATLYFKVKPEAKENEDRVCSLSDKLLDMKCQLTRIETLYEDSLTPINAERIAEFLRMEKATDVNIAEESEVVFFTQNNERYMVDCRRLPQQIIIRIDWNLKGDNANFDIAERAASIVTDALIMVKASVDKEDESMGFYIVSPDHTMPSFKGNFSMYMSILADAESRFRESYWKTMEIEHPEACQDKLENKSSDNTETFAMKIAQMKGSQNKVKS